MDSLSLARLAVAAAADKKGENILLLDLRGVSTVADYFVICSGNVGRQLDAIADNVREAIKRNGRKTNPRVEGHVDSGWVLLDYGELVIHLFTPSRRAFYNLEGLWNKAPVLLSMQ